jgi:WhiB family redox-sensing transcriptional regulator
MDDSLCLPRHHDLFFEKAANGRFVYDKQAKSICALCPVRVQCLDDAMADVEREGIWGGYNEGDRRKLRAEWRGDDEFRSLIDQAIGEVVVDVKDEEMRRLQGVL